ncbi:hypothetical protein SAMN05660420_01200 [Desulfuromusa kysingii]|uniref:Outer membrane lipoprotein-sorting protein n=1 Tax=Desulfuromusa kysingii TaxID=37625 RepID=A0A1H3YFS1_9BACT|nr:DUF4292 domain-containing protein [Desulfuromusa kysingii]SEA09782.1 hypothetical protein SAMN05660420_01200 [Desulfuromusa kysingii]
MRWLIILLLLGLAGCAQPPKPLWTELPTADELIEKVSFDAGQYLSLDGAAHVDLTAKGKFFSSEQFLLLQRPDRVRADVLTGFGQLVLQLVSDGDQLSVFLNTTVPGRFFSGPASYENIFRFIRVPLKTPDLLELLLYDPPLLAYQDSSVVLMSKGVKLVLENGDNKQELLFDYQLRLIGSYYYRAGDKYLAVDYKNMSIENPFPEVIKIAIPLEETRVTVSFSEVRMNEIIDPTRFQLERPDNALLEHLP